MSHLLVSATHKSSGKTTLTIGLCAALRARGLGVQPFKKGPDYIDPLWLGGAAGRPCHNLDFNTESRSEIREAFARRMAGADLGVIEGNLGLFDGLDLEGGNSNAALAALLDAPVVLVIDAEGMTRGVAPLLLGYQEFDPGIRIAGVILNNVAGGRHERRLRQVVERYSSIPLLGVVHRDPALRIVERHLGLMPSNEAEQAEETIARIRDLVAAQVELDAIVGVARSAPAIGPPAHSAGEPWSGARVRIGIARDAAFGFYYPGDLEVIERCGGELVPIDTLSDGRLPPIDGLFLGGGFPESRMEALEANASLREAVRAFIEGGGPAYAECGGLMYLSRSLTWKGKRCNMVGVVPGDAVMYERPQGRGYVRLRETGASPWPSSGGQAVEIAAHEFHYSRLENLEPPAAYAYEVLRGTGIDGSHDGIVHKNLLASYSHMRNVGGNRWAERFVAHVRACSGG
ncbi:MAG: cobyrinate a,c-diamide synthase [Chromatiales bacterium]|jgi:cobyrinic acid a,c-diamide synthase